MNTGCLAIRGSPGEINPVSPGFLCFFSCLQDGKMSALDFVMSFPIENTWFTDISGVFLVHRNIILVSADSTVYLLGCSSIFSDKLPDEMNHNFSL